MDKEPTSGQTEDHMLVDGKRTKCTATVFSGGRMDAPTTENISMIRSTVMVCLLGQTAAFMMAAGLMVVNTEWVLILQLMGALAKVNGLMESA